jgi:hypothetical protein
VVLYFPVNLFWAVTWGRPSHPTCAVQWLTTGRLFSPGTSAHPEIKSVTYDRSVVFSRYSGPSWDKVSDLPGADSGGAHPARAPLKLEKIWFFGGKIVIFHTKYLKIFAPASAIGKNMIFWRKIVIFHTKYPKNVRASLRSAQFF